MQCRIPTLPALLFFLLIGGGAGRSATVGVPAGGNLQAALNAALPGDTILLAAGAVYQGNFVLPQKAGTAFITITGASPLPAGVRVSPANAPSMPKLVSLNGSPALQTAPGAHHYRMIGLEIMPPAGVYSYNLVELGSTSAVAASEQAYEIELDRVYIHGDPAAGAKRGITLNSGKTIIRNSYISDIKSRIQDSQAICGWNGPGPYTILNNYLEAAGENLLFGGAVPASPGVTPSDITIRGNHFYKPLSWKQGDPSYAGVPWVVKNLFELKNAHRVEFDRNLLENCWPQSQKGHAILINSGVEVADSAVEDVHLTNNIVRNAAHGITVATSWLVSTTPLPTRRIAIRNNLVYNTPGFFLFLGTAVHDVTIEHNTALTGTALQAGDAGANFQNAVIRNNIWQRAGGGVMGYNKGEGTATLAAYFPGYVFARNVLIAANAALYPAGTFTPPNLASVGFVNAAADDYRLSATSPYRGAATDGRDIGINAYPLPNLATIASRPAK